jgi:predicted DNA-binding protein with PD1-like motif
MKMSFSQLAAGRLFLVRAVYDSEIIKAVTEFAKENEIMAASFTVIGALKCAKLGFYDQEKHEYFETLLLAPQEIASCMGNISIKDGEPFVHAYIVLADHNSNTKAGHLLEGKVFAAEVYLTELLGGKLVRKNDTVTGLSLWDI